MNVEQAVLEWLKEQKGSVAEKTRGLNVSYCQKHIIPDFGNIELDNLLAEKVNKAVGDKLMRETSLAVRTKARVVLCLIQALEFISDKYEIDIPISDIQVPKYTDEPVRVLDENEINLLIENISSENNTYVIGAVICLRIGLSDKKICGIRWVDINLNERYISFPNGEICIDEFLVSVLEKTGTHDPHECLVSGSKRVLSVPVFRRMVHKYGEEIGINDLTTAVLRNTFAVNEIKAGADLKYLAEVLGHSGVNGFKQKYRHYLKEAAQEKSVENAAVFLDENQQEKLVKYLLQGMDMTKIGAVLCLYAGMTENELTLLKWSKDDDLLARYGEEVDIEGLNFNVLRNTFAVNFLKRGYGIKMPVDWYKNR